MYTPASGERRSWMISWTRLSLMDSSSRSRWYWQPDVEENQGRRGRPREAGSHHARAHGLRRRPRVRQLSESRDIPILIFSVKDLSPDERERLRGSVQAVVTKGAMGDLPRELLAGVYFSSAGTRGDRPPRPRP